MNGTSELTRRPWATVATVLGFAMLAVYVTLILSQGDSVLDVFPWVLLMSIAAVLSLVGALMGNARTARNYLLGAAVLYAFIGMAAILTIGILFLLAAAAAVVAVTRLQTETE